MRGLGAITATLGLALAFTAGALLAGPRTPSPARTVPVAAATASSTMSRAELATVVRAELAASVDARPGALTAGAALRRELDEVAVGDALAEPAPDVMERAARATAVIDAALTRGAWTDADGELLHDHLAGVPGDDAVAILARRNDAVNRGELRVATTGLPF